MSTFQSKAELRKIRCVQFGIMGPEELKELSVCAVEYPESYEPGTVKPKKNGLLDLRMGTCLKEYKCETCHGGINDCPGHFGHIELAKPMFHAGFFPIVLKILRCICYHCAKLIVDVSDGNFRKAMRIPKSKDRLSFIEKICKGKKVCDAGEQHGGCGGSLPNIKREKESMKIVAEFNQVQDESVEKIQHLTAERVHGIFRRISDEDCRVLGLDPKWSRPDWMIITIFPVPPPAVRPTIQMDAFSRSEDDLTHKLAEIVKANIQLKKHEQGGATTQVIQEFSKVMQWHISTFFNNEMPGEPQAKQKARPLKTIRQRLRGKEGRIRGNLMGKRVDFSARTVITPDPTISIDEVGVPRSIALNLTYPEIVTPFNIHKLRELVNNSIEKGPSYHPGAKYIINHDGLRYDLQHVKKPHLEFGFKVERHLQEGDLIIFNRQPSLHKMSMMGHRIRIMPYSTFRLNLSVTTPYNADFDGDEMNLHVPQSLETRAEVMELMMVPKQIIAPQNNKPCMGIVQDTLLGCRLFTKRDTFLTKDLVMNIMMWIADFDGKIPIPAILRPQELWTGKQIFSMIIPNVNLVKYSNGHPRTEGAPPRYFISLTDTKVLIEKGELISGIVDKNTVGNKHGSLIHIIMNEKGSDKCRRFLDETQLIVNYWLLYHGFSVGLGDTIADEATMEDINRIINSAKKQVKTLIKSTQKKSMLLSKFEEEVNGALNGARDKAGASASESLKETNNIKAMVLAGSKGNSINISQIIACVGQQNPEGKRIQFNFFNRTLPHFSKDDYGPESRGFVENSYLRGLTPQEFFFHAMGGREGLIDTAVKTSESGYIQRRLIKATEDVMVQYDGTVRNSTGEIVQFAYGEDCIDGAHIETQGLDLALLNQNAFNKKFKFSLD
jgi:DNA-directed RNA polymerase II subunit RPB1